MKKYFLLIEKKIEKKNKNLIIFFLNWKKKFNKQLQKIKKKLQKIKKKLQKKKIKKRIYKEKKNFVKNFFFFFIKKKNW